MEHFAIQKFVLKVVYNYQSNIFPRRTWLNIDSLGALKEELIRESLGKNLNVNVDAQFKF